MLATVLATGALGVTVRLPEGTVLAEDKASHARFDDAARALGWVVDFHPELHLELAAPPTAQHRRDVERHVRAVFTLAYHGRPPPAELPGPGRPRTDDPTWTPMIELATVDVDGGRALYVLHRMFYQPGLEVVMGHLLVPVARGLFEARWIAPDRTTGARESVLLMEAMGRDAKARLTQAQVDDPALDARFPGHALSRARGVGRWWDGRVSVTAPPRTWPDELALEVVGCTIARPPRFVPRPGFRVGPMAVQRLERVSFCGTDGVDRVTIVRLDERVRGDDAGARLAAVARATIRDQLVEPGRLSAPIEVTPHGDGVEVRAERGGTGGVRALSRWFLDRDDRPWGLGVTSTEAIPLDELAALVDGLCASWRLA